MREVGVISYATSAVAKDLFHNEIEIIVPVFGEAVQRSGMQKSDIDFVCSGSLDYLFGGPFAFVAGVDAVGAVPPIRESHVEMDGAWALYEAWCYIQTGEIDSAVIYGFSKGSSGDPLELMTVQTDPYYTVPLWPSMSDLAALQARTFMQRTGATERDLAEVAARAMRNGTSIDYAVRSSADATAEQLLAESPLVSDPLRESDIYPVSDGATVVVIAAAAFYALGRQRSALPRLRRPAFFESTCGRATCSRPVDPRESGSALSLSPPVGLFVARLPFGRLALKRSCFVRLFDTASDHLDGSLM